MIRVSFAAACLATVVGIAAPRPALAGFIASNLGSGGSYNTNGSYTLSGPQSATGLGYSLAVEFQVSGSSPVAFGSAQLALEHHLGANVLDVLLASDSGGMPGSTIDTMHLAGIPDGPSLVTATSATDPMLAAGVNYWLVAVASTDSYFSWMINSQGQANHLAYQINHGSGPLGWQSAQGNMDVAFSISAAVPTPPAASLLGIGLLTVGGFSIGRRRFSRPAEVA